MLPLVKPLPNPYYVPGYGTDAEVIAYMRAYIVHRQKATGKVHPEYADEQRLRAFEAEHVQGGADFRQRILDKHKAAEKA